jgi:phosphopantothenoylcysteine decarboxylase/phosphopantothenate--cysteine ligase
MRILVTSGGTRVPIDRVRHIGNMSNGTFGARIALQLLRNDPDPELLTFFHARHSKTPFVVPIDASSGLFDEQLFQLAELRKEFPRYSFAYREQSYGDFHEYERGLRALALNHDVVVLAAAVSDYLVGNYVDGKIRSSKDALRIDLELAPKLIGEIRALNPKCVMVGFKLLVDSNDDDLVAAAKESAIKNDCALVVANDLRDIQRGQHRVLLVNKDGLVARHDSSSRRGPARHGDDPPNKLADEVAKAILSLARTAGVK